MVIKRLREYEAKTKLKTIKRLREQQETQNSNSTMADRLTNLPESLQLHILSSLETKYAVRTSILSKSWVSSWACIPILNFSSYSFEKLHDFDKFVFNTLSLRQPLKLDKLTFQRGGICSSKILKKVFDYVFSRGVSELEADINRTRKDISWPIWSHTSSDTLTSLKLMSHESMGCPFLGPIRSGSFKNLTNLHLISAIITDLDPFSGFPALQKLILINFQLQTDGNCLNVHSMRLSELTISSYFQHVNSCELAAPKLRYFEYQGINFPKVKTHKGGLSVLDTVVIDHKGCCYRYEEKKLFDDFMKLFDSFYNVRLLTIFSSVVHLLSLFRDELVDRCSPFRDLKCLKLDFSHFHMQKLFEGPCASLIESLKLIPEVKGYLLQKLHDVKCTIIYPHDANVESACSNTQKCVCLQKNTIKLA